MEAGPHQRATTESVGNAAIISLFPPTETADSLIFQVGNFTLSIHEDGAEWSLAGETVDTHMAVARVIGGISLSDPIPSVGGPSAEIQVGKMRPIHRRLLKAIPVSEWVNFGAGIWCSHDGERLSIALTPTTDPS